MGAVSKVRTLKWGKDSWHFFSNFAEGAEVSPEERGEGIGGVVDDPLVTLKGQWVRKKGPRGSVG